MKPDSFDPYSPPELPVAFRGTKSKSSIRTWLVAVAVITIALTSLSALGALSGLVTTCFPDMILTSHSKSGNAELDAAQAQMNQGLIAIQKRYFVMIFLVSLLSLIASLWALAGSVFALLTPPRRRALFVSGCLAYMAAEVFQMGTFFVLQSHTFSLLETFMEEITQTTGGNSPVNIASVTRVILYVSLALTTGYLLAKLGFFIYALIFLRREDVVQLYAGDLVRAEISRSPSSPG